MTIQPLSVTISGTTMKYGTAALAYTVEPSLLPKDYHFAKCAAIALPNRISHVGSDMYVVYVPVRCPDVICTCCARHPCITVPVVSPSVEPVIGLGSNLVFDPGSRELQASGVRILVLAVTPDLTSVFAKISKWRDTKHLEFHIYKVIESPIPTLPAPCYVVIPVDDSAINVGKVFAPESTKKALLRSPKKPSSRHS